MARITETLQAIKLCREYDMTCILSHRSCETNDTIIVDLAVGTSAGYIKAGGTARGEHIAKYNEFLRIEDASYAFTDGVAKGFSASASNVFKSCFSSSFLVLGCAIINVCFSCFS